MNQIGWDMSALSADAVDQHWRTWMRTYWDDRLASIPTELTLEEASAMYTWVIYLSDSLEEGVAKAIASPAAITQHSRLLRDVTTERIVAIQLASKG